MAVLDTIGHTSGPYNQIYLNLKKKFNISICSLDIQKEFQISDEIKFYDGEKNIFKFLRIMHKANKGNQPSIITAHHPRTALLAFFYYIMKKPRPKMIYIIHSMFSNYNWLQSLIIYILMVFYDKIIFVSKSAYASFPLFYKRILKFDKYEIIPNGADINRIKKVFPKNKDNRTFRLITVGRLIKVKNQESLIKAFHEILQNNIKLYIIGSGKLRHKLLSIANNNKNIVFCGNLPRDEVFKTMKESDLFVSTSYWEGLPVTVIEAMACGCPVILSDIGPHREIAEGADFIPLISPYNISDFSKAIIEFTKMDKDEIDSIRERCKKHISMSFSVSQMCLKYEKCFKKIVE